jgi:hypothetical protein
MLSHMNNVKLIWHACLPSCISCKCVLLLKVEQVLKYNESGYLRIGVKINNFYLNYCMIRGKVIAILREDMCASILCL